MSAADDHEAIRTLLYRYAERIDAADFAGVGALFAEGELRGQAMPAPLRGAAAVERLYRTANRVHEDGTLRTKHVVANPIIELAPDGASATCRSGYVVYQATARLPLQPIVAGRYHDRLVRGAEGAWRFASREIFVDLVGDVSDHLRIPIPGPAGA